MSDQDALTPRVIIFRHGETEWAKSGRFTSSTDIGLTPAGVAQVSSASAKFVGAGKLVDPCRLALVFVSPRVRAVDTFALLLPPASSGVGADKVVYTEEITEWNYGHYEGLKDQEIRLLRKNGGLDKESEWNIWSDGCEGGESKQQVTERLDRLILHIKETQKPYMRGEKPVDVLLVAHGLILRCFVKRWLGLSIDNPLPMILAPGAIAVLSYKNNDVDKPAFHVGLAPPSEE
ncbi:putative phosphoglycerate mutase [Melanomma pulvis-pyrius CBS 109.77]|uniref:Putative phosphoglycerate mutase n=1 Tax=Melanomma pulvis-pyrius CBS 109.77 TaxID=1314802 RepID=A0A6A6X0G3_9PLEO|nr:putative phosphoglycerate mutase [Melanomma pulvis-pyrius CBS 109.77]